MQQRKKVLATFNPDVNFVIIILKLSEEKYTPKTYNLGYINILEYLLKKGDKTKVYCIWTELQEMPVNELRNNLSFKNQ